MTKEKMGEEGLRPSPHSLTRPLEGAAKVGAHFPSIFSRHTKNAMAPTTLVAASPAALVSTLLSYAAAVGVAVFLAWFAQFSLFWVFVFPSFSYCPSRSRVAAACLPSPIQCLPAPPAPTHPHGWVGGCLGGAAVGWGWRSWRPVRRRCEGGWCSPRWLACAASSPPVSRALPFLPSPHTQNKKQQAVVPHPPPVHRPEAPARAQVR
jgi:hypothetical protein